MTSFQKPNYTKIKNSSGGFDPSYSFPIKSSNFVLTSVKNTSVKSSNESMLIEQLKENVKELNEFIKDVMNPYGTQDQIAKKNAEEEKKNLEKNEYNEKKLNEHKYKNLKEKFKTEGFLKITSPQTVFHAALKGQNYLYSLYLKKPQKSILHKFMQFLKGIARQFQSEKPKPKM